MWTVKEAFRDIYAAADRAEAERQLAVWQNHVASYQVGELDTFATTIARWEQQFLNYFDS